MPWTDERIDLLKKLHQDGLTASQIANQLGGVTRNAVLGKAYRLGLSQPSGPSAPGRPRNGSEPRRQRPASHHVPLATRRSPAAGATPQRPPAPNAVFSAEPAGMATPLSLCAHMCKWPIGDPASDAFSFCGRRVGIAVYCDEHAQVAYKPGGGKEVKVNDLYRSLRRYL